MFKPAKVLHSLIVVPRSNVSSLITGLYEQGICEPKEIDTDLEPIFDHEKAKRVYEADQRIKFVVDSLEPFKDVVQPEKLLRSLFKPTRPLRYNIDLRPKGEIIEEVERHLDIIEPKIREKIERIAKLRERIEQNKFLESNLDLMPDLDTSLFKPSKNISIALGVSSTNGLDKIKDDLASKAIVGIKEISKNQRLIAIFSLPGDSL